MYLTELYRFYERMTQDPQSGMPPEGMSAEAIHFALVIGEDGSLKGVHDLRDSKGKPLRRFVPAAVKRTSTKVLPNFLWDNTGYVLGVDGKGNPAFTARKYESFRTFHRQLCAASPDRHARALLAFFDRWTPEQFGSIGERRPCWTAMWSSSSKETRTSSTSSPPCTVSGRTLWQCRMHAHRGSASSQVSKALS